MDKPLSMKIQETKARLVNVCNDSDLHISVLQLIINEIHTELNKANEQCMKDEFAEYQEAISKEQSNEEQPSEEVE